MGSQDPVISYRTHLPDMWAKLGEGGQGSLLASDWSLA